MKKFIKVKKKQKWFKWFFEDIKINHPQTIKGFDKIKNCNTASSINQKIYVLQCLFKIKKMCWKSENNTQEKIRNCFIYSYMKQFKTELINFKSNVKSLYCGVPNANISTWYINISGFISIIWYKYKRY